MPPTKAPARRQDPEEEGEEELDEEEFVARHSLDGLDHKVPQEQAPSRAEARQLVRMVVRMVW